MTSYIATDLASAPFLLGAAARDLFADASSQLFGSAHYSPPRQSRDWRLSPVAPLSVGLLGAPGDYWFTLVVLNLVAFVLLSLLCNGELYKRRPAPEHLTEFYLWTSLGGALGGGFAALAAPNLFPLVYEYPILDCGGAARPAKRIRVWPRRRRRGSSPRRLLITLLAACRSACLRNRVANRG